MSRLYIADTGLFVAMGQPRTVGTRPFGGSLAGTISPTSVPANGARSRLLSWNRWFLSYRSIRWKSDLTSVFPLIALPAFVYYLTPVIRKLARKTILAIASIQLMLRKS